MGPARTYTTKTLLGQIAELAALTWPLKEVGCRTHHAGDGVHEFGPLRMFAPELLPPGGRKAIIPGAAAVLRDLPFGGDPAFDLQALECRIERAELDIQGLVRSAANGLGDAIPMQRSEEESAEHQHVERALQQVHIEAFYMKIGYITRANAGLGRVPLGRRLPTVANLPHRGTR